MFTRRNALLTSALAAGTFSAPETTAMLLGHCRSESRAIEMVRASSSSSTMRPLASTKWLSTSPATPRCCSWATSATVR